MADRTIPAEVVHDIARQLGYEPKTVTAIRIDHRTVEVDAIPAARRAEPDTYRHRIDRGPAPRTGTEDGRG